MPFTHLATHPDGRVTPCCESKLYSANNNIPLHLGQTSVESIRTSENFNELRTDMLNGKLHSSCDFCYVREQAGLESKRLRENKKFSVDYSNLSKYESLPLQNIELRLGNICNAKCVICHPGASSKWNEDITDEIRTFDGSYNKQIFTNTWFRDEDFYNTLLEYSSTIQHIWFNGGEPLLIKEHLRFIKKLIDLGLAKTVTLEYHTNGTLITNEIIEIWKQFKFVKVTLSLDDIHKRFNYSRFPLTFDQVENGIKLLKANNIHYDIIPTVNLLNVFNTTNIYEYFFNKYGKKCVFNYLRFPKFQSITNLPKQFKDRIIAESRLPDDLHKQLEFEIHNNTEEELSKAFNFYSTLDRQRGLKLTDYLPEFIELKEYEGRI